MTYELRALNHNLAGGYVNDGASPETVEALVDQVAAFAPDVLMLQEVTADQLTLLVAALPDFDFGTSFVPMHVNILGQLKGQALASRHGLSDVTQVPLGYSDGLREFTLTHAKTTLPGGIAARVANTHLRAQITPGANLGRRRQAQLIAAVLAPFVDAGEVVVLGGDMNCTPSGDPVDHLYADGTNARGDFYECDQTDSSNSSPRDGDGTVVATGSKYDYVFFSARNTTTASLSGGQVVNPLSDHKILRGLADVSQASALY